MPLLRWIPEYSVNEASLDGHHQKMFHILNTVYENMMYSLELECIIPFMDELSELTQSHISAEEKYMMEIDDPYINDHIAKHREFTHEMEVLRKNYHGNNLEVAQELIVLLGEWLLRHVINDDWKYSEMSALSVNRAKISRSSS